jgi:hypothetical protein
MGKSPPSSHFRCDPPGPLIAEQAVGQKFNSPQIPRQTSQRLDRDVDMRRAICMVAVELSPRPHRRPRRRRKFKTQKMHSRCFLRVFAVQVYVGDGVDAVMTFGFDEQTACDKQTDFDARSGVKSFMKG